jgi:hypothetical protein
MVVFVLMNERALSVSFVEFRVAKVAASNLRHWAFETPAAIVIVDELSRKAVHLLDKRIFYSGWRQCKRRTSGVASPFPQMNELGFVRIFTLVIPTFFV